MNEDITAPNHDGSDRADAASGLPPTGFNRAAAYPAARDRDTRRRDKIREELVREHFAQEKIDAEQKSSPGLRHWWSKLFKLD